MVRSLDEGPSVSPVLPNHTVVPALMSGAVQATIFNPVDRALYLRVYHRRPFFHPENWRQPFQGFGNAAVYRTIASGTYLFWQDETRARLLAFSPELENSPTQLQLLVGTLAGSANGFSLNQLQIVKYHTWSTPEGRFLPTCKKMLEEGGWRIFFRGASISVGRDFAFGVAYETLRVPHWSRDRGEWVQFAANTSAAIVACTLSAPINYCRNIIYGAPPSGCPLRAAQLIAFLAHEVKAAGTKPEQWRHLNDRLNIGWGSVRVGVGMAVGQLVFGRCKALYNTIDETLVNSEEL